MDIGAIACGLELREDGIWVSRGKSSISYPEEGNGVYFEVEDASFWFQHRNRCLLEILKRFPPNGAFMDIGGGNGYVSLAIQNAGLPVALLEPGLLGARNARRRGIENVISSTFEDAGILPGSLASAGAFDVVEHIEDDAGFLKSIARALAPGGRLYLTVPAHPALWSHEDEDAGHYRRYTAATLRSVLGDAGFHVEYLTHFFRFLSLPILLLRTLPYRMGVRRKSGDLQQVSAEHRGPAGPWKSVHDKLLEKELAIIRSGRTMNSGSSCLAVAHKS